MLEAPEVEAHHHKSGHSRVDLILGLLAVFLSGVSVFIALRHGDTMERLVAANSWPNLTYATGNESDDGKPEITFSIRNTGVGPARVDTLEFFYKDKPMATSKDFLIACCGHGSYSFDFSSISGEVLPAREKIAFLALKPENNRKEIAEVLDRERLQVRVRACYCSVFDECWVMDSGARRPVRAEHCAPSQPIQYHE